MKRSMLPRLLGLMTGLLCLTLSVTAQNKTVTGKVTDSQGASALAGVSVAVKGAQTGAQTDANGGYSISVPAGATLIFTFVGYATQEVAVGDRTTVDVVLVAQAASNLNEVVVVGYGTQRKKDLTGAVSSVKEKDFNRGVMPSPDQLIQGKAAGVLVVNNSGQPGGATTVKIRGNAAIRGGAQPLYVIDGVIIDGRSALPGQNAGGIGTAPGTNPLNFINPNDIATIDVLKDASATAIYGSRGAYGVILVTTKRGASGAPKLDFGASVGWSTASNKIDILDAGQYRAALQDYGLTSGDGKANVNAQDDILRTGMSQNYNVSASGGIDNAKIRFSGGYFSQEGIVLKSKFEKLTAGLNGNFKFLDSKKLGLDINLVVTQINEDFAPLSTDAGFTGNLISQALQWNPTDSLYKSNGDFNILRGSTTVNPLAMSAAFDDQGKTNTILASVSPYYKFNNNLEFRMLFARTASQGTRRTQIRDFINLENIIDRGVAGIGANELTTNQFTTTLSYNKDFDNDLTFNGVIGYEYMEFINRGFGGSARDFGSFPINYTDYLQYSSQGTRSLFSFADPTNELQSALGRITLGWKSRFLVTASFRMDGSTKFGENNKYGFFPAVAAAWNISEEGFMKGGETFSNLKLRAGWGITGNQEFPSGASQARYAFTGPGAFSQVNYPNPDLKWQQDRQWNVGLDYGIFGGRVYGSIDYFDKLTSDLLYPTITPQPAPPGAPPTWRNLEGKVANSGLEFSANAMIIKNQSFQWDLGFNATWLKNEVSDMPGPLETGALHGQGITGATVQRIANGYPINVYYVRQYEGLDKDGQGIYTDEGFTKYYLGNPNPDFLLGVTTSLAWKKLALSMNMNGNFGQELYNNTANSVIPIGNLGSRNIASNLLGVNPKEALSNPITPSSRYIEDGSFFRLSNATLSYQIGPIGKAFRNSTVFVTGQNLLLFTDYTGYDPEVNTDKNVNGVPSVGIDYTSYPFSRTFLIGFTVSL